MESSTECRIGNGSWNDYRCRRSSSRRRRYRECRSRHRHRDRNRDIISLDVDSLLDVIAIIFQNEESSRDDVEPYWYLFHNKQQQHHNQ
jgi:hypothetical protein